MKINFSLYAMYVVLIVGGLFFLGGCKSGELQTIEDSVSIIDLTTGHEAKRYLKDNGKGFITGQTYYPEVIIVYEPIDDYTKEDVFGEVVTILKNNDWEDNGRTDVDSFRAFLQYDGHPLTVWVNISQEKDEVVLIVEGDSSFYHMPTSTPSSTPIPRATNATPEVRINSTMFKGRDGMILLYVPAGEFTMGNDEDKPIMDDPIHTVYLDAFWIDQTEVSNEMYAKCVHTGQCDLANNTLSDSFNKPSFANRPVVNVDWNMANAYCAWVGRRLPTEAEWEKAARGTDEHTYPWGEEIDCDKANYQSNCIGETSPVGHYEEGKSPYGAYDMAGNALEWVNDWYDESYYQNSSSSNPQGPDSGRFKVTRGGSWSGADFLANASYRTWANPTYKNSNYGFRCARSFP